VLSRRRPAGRTGRGLALGPPGPVRRTVGPAQEQHKNSIGAPDSRTWDRTGGRAIGPTHSRARSSAGGGGAHSARGGPPTPAGTNSLGGVSCSVPTQVSHFLAQCHTSRKIRLRRHATPPSWLAPPPLSDLEPGGGLVNRHYRARPCGGPVILQNRARSPGSWIRNRGRTVAARPLGNRDGTAGRGVGTPGPGSRGGSGKSFRHGLTARDQFGSFGAPPDSVRSARRPDDTRRVGFDRRHPEKPTRYAQRE
jgi:hypothetical protein